ncbi:MAG TPA: hypothetical protein VFP33_05070, partial [Gallionella sp.]|nr:hypothetical protein [Gallionella sp.]
MIAKKKIYLAVLLALSVNAAAVADDKPAKAAPAKLWSWQPVQHVDAPQVKQKNWVRTPVDAFVLAKLEEKGIKPSRDAERA